jgi:hypothetical protein
MEDLVETLSWLCGEGLIEIKDELSELRVITLTQKGEETARGTKRHSGVADFR